MKEKLIKRMEILMRIRIIEMLFGILFILIFIIPFFENKIILDYLMVSIAFAGILIFIFITLFLYNFYKYLKIIN
jgi:hypothetical protein